MPVQFRKHSTTIGHPARCSCEPCHSARNWNLKLSRSGYRKQIPVEAIRDHLQAIHAATGRSVQAVMKLTGLPEGTVSHLLSDVTTAVKPETASAILAVNVAAIEPVAYPRSLYRWRIHVLAAQGFTLSMLESFIGEGANLSAKGHGTVSAAKWNQLDRLWNAIGERMATPADGMSADNIRRGITRARNKGFYPRAEYENEGDRYPAALDPEVQASVRAADAERAADLDRAVERRVRAGGRRDTILIDLQGIYTAKEIVLSVERVQQRVSRSARAKSQATAA